MSTTSVDRGAVLGYLAEAFAEGKSGILTVMHGKLRRLFCVDDGRITFAASNMIEDQFGERLVRRKRLTPGENIEATRAAAERGMKLSAYLAHENLLDGATLREAIEDHISALLLAAVERPEAEVQFTPGRPDLGQEVTVRLSCLAPLLRYTSRTPSSTDQVRVRIGPPSSRPVCLEGTRERLDAPPLTAAVGYLVDNCNGTHDVATLLAQSPVAAEDTLRTLYALMLLGAVEIRLAETRKEEEPADRMTREECLARIGRADDGDHYALLGLESSASTDEIREAYYYLARRYHPDRFRAGPLRDLAPQLEDYFTKVTEASNTLSDPDLRAAYDAERVNLISKKRTETEMDPTYLAKQNFARAKLLLGKNQFHDALQFLENAVQQDGSKAPYHLELGKVLSRNPRKRTEALEHLLTSTRLDPSLVPSYLALAELYLKMDRGEEAVAMYREVLRWEPANVEARDGLTQLGETAGGKRRFGLFKG